MGQEIAASHFHQQDFHQFERRMVREMALLHEYFRTQRFCSSARRIGLELEMWLTDHSGVPQPANTRFLQQLNSPAVVPELSQFNVEFNVPHQPLSGGGLRQLEHELAGTWDEAHRVAGDCELALVAIGVLPTIQSDHLTLKTMSPLSRFRALNEQVLRLRRGRPIVLKIAGVEQLELVHDDVMLEAAATSLQIHFQVSPAESVRYFNAATIASGPVVGVAANSPLLFGKLLWAESRIPLFETSIELGGAFPRVHFGSGYALESFEEFFLENRGCHPVLLPMELEEPSEMLPHVRLHNGTIWRWNRPLIGFESDGQPHLRLEHRVMPAGPTLVDMLANIAFSAGLIHALATAAEPPENQLTFADAERNFRTAAQHGLDARLTWLDGTTSSLTTLLFEKLLPLAEQGLQALQIDSADVERYLQVIRRRGETEQNGAAWQTAFIARYGRDLPALTRAYTALQREGSPVHEWEL